VFLAENLPKILDMRITGIYKCPSSVAAGKVEAVVDVSVAGKHMVAGFQLFAHPAIEPWQQPKPE
jgi:hypothetical protein